MWQPSRPPDPPAQGAIVCLPELPWRPRPERLAQDISPGTGLVWEGYSFTDCQDKPGEGPHKSSSTQRHSRIVALSVYVT